jgi:hypothetical protein
MAFEPFGLVGGLSVGIPPIVVIDDNGIATLNGLTVTGITNLGPTGNIIITGGENGYFLQTDGEGRLTWAPGGNGGGGNGTPGGSNTQVQYNNAGNFGGDAGFTYDSINNILSVSGNIVSNNFIGTGNITIANINANGNITANYLIGNGSQLTGISATTANFANYAGNVTVSSQPNITSVGTLTNLSVAGNAIAGNANLGNSAVANFFTGRFYGNANTAGTVTTNAQPNITSVGTLTNLSVTGNITTGNANLGNSATANFYFGNGAFLTGVGNANYSPLANFANYAGNVTVSSQPNITSVGTLLNVDTSGNVTATANIIGANVTANQFFNALNANITGSTNLSGAVTVTNTGNITSLGNVNFTSSPNVTLGSVANIHISGGVAGYFLRTDGAGNLSWAVGGGGGGNGTPGGNTTEVQFNDSGTFGASANFTFNPFSYVLAVPTINTTTVSIANTLTVNTTANLYTTNINGVLTASSNVIMTASPNINLGSVSNLHIQGGTNGYVLATDGAGNLSWTAGGGGGGNGTPGGSNTQIQYNDQGVFNGSSFFTFNENTNNVQVAGNLIANALTLGSGIYAFSRSNVFFAITSSNATQELYAIEADTISGADFTIIATDATANTRQVSKISSIFLGEAYQYNEYSTLAVNGATGYYSMAYLPGNISVTPQFVLYVTPTTNNNIVHKISIQSYDI